MENQREIALMHVVAVGELVGEMTEHNDGVALHHKLIHAASRCPRVLGAYDLCCLLSRWRQNAVVVVARRMLPALLQIPRDLLVPDMPAVIRHDALRVARTYTEFAIIGQ